MLLDWQASISLMLCIPLCLCFKNKGIVFFLKHKNGGLHNSKFTQLCFKHNTIAVTLCDR